MPGLVCVAGLGKGTPPVSSPTRPALVTAHLSWADRTTLVSVVVVCSGVHQPSCWAVLDAGSRLHLNSFSELLVLTRFFLGPFAVGRPGDTSPCPGGHGGVKAGRPGE